MTKIQNINNINKKLKIGFRFSISDTHNKPRISSNEKRVSKNYG